ncbi:MAG: Hpt domain-containing protein [Ideonella sp.]
MLTWRRVVCMPVGSADSAGGGASLSAEDTGKPALLDPGALARLRELDPQGKAKLFERVVQAFNTSTTRMLPQLIAAGQAGDLNGVRHVAHTLKSSSASLGATLLSQMCADLEHQMRAGIERDVELQIDRIAAEIGVVIKALKVMTEPAE